MFRTLCKTRKIPNIEFFLNKRDFPLIKKNYSEAYDNIFDSDKEPLKSFCPKDGKFCPVLSMSSTNSFADILIPNHNDWCQIAITKKQFFPEQVQIVNEEKMNYNIKWKNKINTAIFRGSSTGVQTSEEKNLRLKVSAMSNLKIKDKDNIYFLNCGITNWNLRARKNKK